MKALRACGFDRTIIRSSGLLSRMILEWRP